MADHEPLDVDVSEYGMTLYSPAARLPRTTKLHQCSCGARLWLKSDGTVVRCDCGESWMQFPVGQIQNAKLELGSLVHRIKDDDALMGMLMAMLTKKMEQDLPQASMTMMEPKSHD